MSDHKIYKKVIVVNSDDRDWSGIFLSDGKDNYTLWTENHSLHTEDWIENSYDLDCVEEQKLVTVRTFKKRI